MAACAEFVFVTRTAIARYLLPVRALAPLRRVPLLVRVLAQPEQRVLALVRALAPLRRELHLVRAVAQRVQRVLELPGLAVLPIAPAMLLMHELILPFPVRRVVVVRGLRAAVRQQQRLVVFLIELAFLPAQRLIQLFVGPVVVVQGLRAAPVVQQHQRLVVFPIGLAFLPAHGVRLLFVRLAAAAARGLQAAAVLPGLALRGPGPVRECLLGVGLILEPHQ